MIIFGIILLAVSLSMDALVIGISYGFCKTRLPVFAKLIISTISVAFTAVAIVAGNIIASLVAPFFANLLGCAMLILLGFFVILREVSRKKCGEEEACPRPAVTPKEAMYLGVALSIDSLCVGISSAAIGLGTVFAPLAVGVFQYLFLSLGEFSGEKICTVSKIKPKIFTMFSGTLLIFLALLRIFL